MTTPDLTPDFVLHLTRTTVVTPTIKEIVYAMPNITVHDTDPPLTATVVADDANGNVTTFDNIPTWTDSPTGIVSMTSSSDGTSATIVPVAVGSTTVTVSTTNSSGTVITVTGDVTVVGGDVASLTLTFTPGSSTPPAGG